MGAMTDATLVLVGNAKAGTISSFRLAEGALEPLATSTVGAGCGTFAVDEARDLVYCATKEPDAGVLTLALDRATGELDEVARFAIGDHVAYLSLAREGSVLLGASYHGGWGTAWPVTDGRLGEPSSRVEHANIHCVVTDSAGEHAYFVSLGDDLIAQCALSADAELEPLVAPTVSVAPGSGARQLVLSHDQRSAYLMTEFTGEAIRFERDATTGELTVAESVAAHATDRGLSVSEYGADPQADHLIWGADLHLVDGEHFLVCSERTESTLATVALDAEGHLGEVVAITGTEAQPRGFNVTPDGRHLVVAGEGSGHVALYRVEQDGSLEQLDRAESGKGANWVRFA